VEENVILREDKEQQYEKKQIRCSMDDAGRLVDDGNGIHYRG